MKPAVPAPGVASDTYCLTASPADLARYRQLVLPEEVLSVSADTMRALQAAHLDAFPYSNLDSMLGRGLLDLGDYLAHLMDSGRGGICYQLNYSLSLVLRAVGFRVDYLWGTVSDRRGEPGSLAGNHLGLRVSDGDREWLVDAGLGDALREPVPLSPATIHQGPFTYELLEESDRWVLVHDPRGAFAEVVFDRRAVDLSVFEKPAERLVSEFDFRRTLVVMQRRHEEVWTLRGRVFDVVDGGGRRRTIAESRDEWLTILRSRFNMNLADVGADQLADLWQHVCTAHEEWLATA